MSRAKQHKNYKDEWETPPELMAAIEARYGKFDLDVAATAATAKAPRFFTKEDDALMQPWTGKNVWMNPPYGRGIGAWIRKAVEAVLSGRVQHLVALLPANTSTKWFAEAFREADDIRFLTGRVSFLLAGMPHRGNTGGSVIMTFNHRLQGHVPRIWDWRNP
jgi:site-specific DNA-methyltransferase (adenine-specific)